MGRELLCKLIGKIRQFPTGCGARRLAARQCKWQQRTPEHALTPIVVDGETGALLAQKRLSKRLQVGGFPVTEVLKPGNLEMRRLFTGKTGQRRGPRRRQSVCGWTDRASGRASDTLLARAVPTRSSCAPTRVLTSSTVADFFAPSTRGCAAARGLAEELAPNPTAPWSRDRARLVGMLEQVGVVDARLDVGRADADRGARAVGRRGLSESTCCSRATNRKRWRAPIGGTLRRVQVRRAPQGCRTLWKVDDFGQELAATAACGRQLLAAAVAVVEESATALLLDDIVGRSTGPVLTWRGRRPNRPGGDAAARPMSGPAQRSAGPLRPPASATRPRRSAGSSCSRSLVPCGVRER